MFHSLSVKTRLTIMALLPAVFFIGMSATVISVLQKQNQGVESLYKDRIVAVEQLKHVSDVFAVKIVTLLQKHRADMLSQSEVLKAIEEAESSSDKEWLAYLDTVLTDEEQVMAKTTEQLYGPVMEVLTEYKSMIKAGSLSRLSDNEFNSKLYDAFDPMVASFENLIELQLRESNNFVAMTQENFLSTRALLIFSAVVVLMVMLVSAWLIYRSISQPLLQLQQTIVAVAENTDLTQRANVSGNDEIATAAFAFNNMLATINNLVREVSEATLSLSSAAEEMNAISSQVSNTAKEQELQNTMIATAVTEMSTAIQEVANSALVTSQKANDADKQAVNGQQKVQQNIDSINVLSSVVNDSTDVIQQLHNQANEINQVVQLIQSVAEQTNLLALNAAIEAARAGESGRGFAVVADEVRQLAHNTQKATGTISEMIGKLQVAAQKSVESMSKARERAGQSVGFAQQSAAVLGEIIQAMSEISAMNTQVATATEEQTMVANDISENVNKFSISIASVTESSQQNSFASKDLAELAENLRLQVSVFKV